MYFAADLLSANQGLVVWLAIVFGALLYLLKRYAWGPITSALEEREQTIADSIGRAEAALAESQRLQESNQQARREAEQEAQLLMRQARDEVEELREAELQRIREEIAEMRSQAQEQIARDKDSALQAVRSEVADLAIMAAETILRENLDAGSNRKLVARFMDEFADNPGTGPPFKA